MTITIVPRLLKDPERFEWEVTTEMEFFDNEACSCRCCAPRQYISVDVRQWDNIDLRFAEALGDVTAASGTPARRLMSSYDALSGAPTRHATMLMPLATGTHRPQLSHLLNIPQLPYFDATYLGIENKQEDDEWSYVVMPWATADGNLRNHMFAEDVSWGTTKGGVASRFARLRGEEAPETPSVPHLIEYDWPDESTFLRRAIETRALLNKRDYPVDRFYKYDPESCKRTWTDHPAHEIGGKARRTDVTYRFIVVARTRNLPECADGSPSGRSALVGTRTIETREFPEYSSGRLFTRNIKLVQTELFTGAEFRRTFGFTLEGDAYTDAWGDVHVHRFSRAKRTITWRSPVSNSSPTSRAVR